MGDLDLARRAMRAAGWALPRPVEVVSERGVLTYRAMDGVLWVDVAPPGPDVEWLPDLDDGATGGRLDALMRERWGAGFEVMPYVTHVRGPEGDLDALAIWWRLEAIGIDAWGSLTHAPVAHPDDVCRRLAGPTRAAALVAALEVSGG